MTAGKARVGNPVVLSARNWNNMLDAGEHFKRHRFDARSNLYYGQIPNESRIVWVKNTYELPVGRFGVLALGDPIISATDNKDAFANRINFSGDAPASTDSDICVTLEPISHGNLGRAVVCGVIQCKVEVPAGGESYEYAAAKSSVINKLRAVSRGPIKILWKEQGTGDKWAYVYLQPNMEPQWPLLCIVTGATTVGSGDSRQWLYSVSQAALAASDGAYPAATAVSGGWSGAAYNLVEDVNAAAFADATGEIPTGIGITPNQLGENFDIVRIPDNWRVSVYPETVTVSTTVPPEDPEDDPVVVTTFEKRYVFSRINPLSGSC